MQNFKKWNREALKPRRRLKPYEPSLPGLLVSGRQRSDPDFWRELRENEAEAGQKPIKEY